MIKYLTLLFFTGSELAGALKTYDFAGMQDKNTLLFSQAGCNATVTLDPPMLSFTNCCATPRTRKPTPKPHPTRPPVPKIHRTPEPTFEPTAEPTRRTKRPTRRTEPPEERPTRYPTPKPTPCPPQEAERLARIAEQERIDQQTACHARCNNI